MKKIVKKLLFAVIVTASIVGGGYYYRITQPSLAGNASIQDVNANDDSDFVIQAFKNDWYWLVADGSFFHPQQMLKDRAYPQYGLIKNNLTMKIGIENGKKTGFTVYYMKTHQLGVLLFLWVTPEFRSKGWGRKLLDYAIKDLVNQGAQKIELTTRTNNEASQRLYTRYGFKEVKRYGPNLGYVEFMYEPQL